MRDGLYCPRCRAESVIKRGSYREYLCTDCDRTFNPKTADIRAREDRPVFPMSVSDKI